MAQKLKHQDPGQTQGQPSGNVAQLPTSCVADGCKKKSEKLGFCAEHYDWFKWGLLTREGKKPVDFDKKYQAFMKHKKAA